MASATKDNGKKIYKMAMEWCARVAVAAIEAPSGKIWEMGTGFRPAGMEGPTKASGAMISTLALAQSRGLVKVFKITSLTFTVGRKWPDFCWDAIRRFSIELQIYCWRWIPQEFKNFYSYEALRGRMMFINYKSKISEKYYKSFLKLRIQWF